MHNPLAVHVSSIHLRNFRIFEELRLDLPPGLIAVVGPNASGKTSLLEGIFLLTAGRSLRARSDTELVRWGSTWARAAAQFIDASGTPIPAAWSIELASTGPRKRLELAGKAISRSADLLLRIPAVLFTPADLQLAQAGPSARRRFMNLAIARLRPAYSDDLSRYRRALELRNRALREGVAQEQLGIWTEQFAAAAAQVVAHRRWFVQRLEPIAARLHERLSGGAERLKLVYRTDAGETADPTEIQEALLRRLGELAEQEREAGRTLAGPHRDDLLLLIHGRPLRRFGSQGQQRTASLALKLAEAELLYGHSGEPPILLLDDCLSELDPVRGQQLLSLTGRYSQLIVTTASMEPALEMAGPALWIKLSAGRVEDVRRP